MVEPRIITVFAQLDIPVRCYDWRAFFEGKAESHMIGWGASPAEASENLRQNYGFFCRLCRREHPVSCHRGGCPVGADL